MNFSVFEFFENGKRLNGFFQRCVVSNFSLTFYSFCFFLLFAGGPIHSAKMIAFFYTGCPFDSCFAFTIHNSIPARTDELEMKCK